MRVAGDPVRSGEAATSLYADIGQSDKFGIHWPTKLQSISRPAEGRAF